MHFRPVLDVEAELPLLQGDTGALNQVFLNLLKNAAEAMGEVGGLIQVSAFQRTGNVYVRVRDSGPGIDSDRREMPFRTVTPLTHLKIFDAGVEVATSDRGTRLVFCQESNQTSCHVYVRLDDPLAELEFAQRRILSSVGRYI